ncbi:MAG: hypothetical protein JZU63_12005, partial [Rhodoferax sp.]|nr:hypothetical protein [Rhodoferax sp.]
MTVYTYYEHLKEIPGNDGYSKLLDLFRASWEKHGWTVKCLGIEDATVNKADYDHYISGIDKAPSLHHDGYRRASYARYLAMLNVGGGLMVDADVMNYGFTPDMLPLNGCYTLQDGSGPYGPAYFYGWLCYMLSHWWEARVPPWPIDGKLHWSDMIFLSGAVPWLEVCLTYKEGPWETKLLTHF